MHKDTFKAMLLSHAQQRIKMLLRRVDLAIRDQAHQVQRPIAPLCTIHCRSENFILKKCTRGDLMIDARNIHSYDST